MGGCLSLVDCRIEVPEDVDGWEKEGIELEICGGPGEMSCVRERSDVPDITELGLLLVVAS